MSIYDKDWYREPQEHREKQEGKLYPYVNRKKKSQKAIKFVIILFLILTLFFLEYKTGTVSDFFERVITDAKELYEKLVSNNEEAAVLGSENNPFDWSTEEKQIATASNLPKEGSMIYVVPTSGQVRPVKEGEISWAERKYTEQYHSKPSTIISNQRPNTVKPENNSTQRSTNTSHQRRESSSQRYTPYIPDPPVIMYYGTDIGQFPPKIRNWVVNKAFTKDKMEDEGNIDPQLRVWWSDDGNSV